MLRRIRSDRDCEMQMRSDQMGTISGASFYYTNISHAGKRVSKEFASMRGPKVISRTPP